MEPETLVELAARGAACPDERALPAYDRGARGLVPGEAAAALVLVRESDRALAFIDAADAADGAKGEASAETIAATAKRVAEGDAVVDGASRAQPAFDAAEREAIAPLLALAAATGATGSATPLVQAIALASLLSRGRLPPIAGLEAPAPGPLRPLTRAETTTARSALGLSTGAPGLAGAIRVYLP